MVCFGGEKKSCKRRQGKKELCVHFVFNRVTKFNARLVYSVPL